MRKKELYLRLESRKREVIRAVAERQYSRRGKRLREHRPGDAELVSRV
jgi:hypothetical protein